jgi:hypothetical protein
MAKKKTMRKIDRVLTVLKKNSQIHIRGIAKIMNYKPAKVSWIIYKYPDKNFIDIKSYEIGGLKLKFVRPKSKKQDIDLIGVLEIVNDRRENNT